MVTHTGLPKTSALHVLPREFDKINIPKVPAFGTTVSRILPSPKILGLQKIIPLSICKKAQIIRLRHSNYHFVNISVFF